MASGRVRLGTRLFARESFYSDDPYDMPPMPCSGPDEGDIGEVARPVASKLSIKTWIKMLIAMLIELR